MIIIKSSQEVDKIRKSGRLASKTLDFVATILKPGITTKSLDKEIHSFIVKHGAIPATLGYRGYPASSCISVNEEVCHGIPGPRVIRDGDLVKVDVTTILDGYFGDTCRSFIVGKASSVAQKLLDATRESMMLAIDTVHDGSSLGDIGAAIQGHVEPLGFSVVRDFVGHGVGCKFHESPNVPHYGSAGSGLKLKKGMTITIEPMINQGTWEVEILKDAWTVVTMDRKLTAQFEHTILVTDDGAEILTVSH
ncbi:MAG: type I methionyl aminopeptidase [Deltaproteobacteria bacterium]|jgi:methionyl aminopeptidase|nr:type I methionyl aminopeptidase [Deltaproteobacteria bacterium]